MSSTDDDNLRQLFHELYESHNKEVRLAAFLVLPNAATADDITQEAFLRLWRQLHAGKTIRHPRAWLLRVARRLAFDHLKSAFHRRIKPLLKNMGEPKSPHPGPQQEAEARDLLSAALATLDPTDRKIFQMHVLEDKSVTEVSNLLGLLPKDIYDRSQRARRQVQQYLAGL